MMNHLLPHFFLCLAVKINGSARVSKEERTRLAGQHVTKLEDGVIILLSLIPSS